MKRRVNIIGALVASLALMPSALAAAEPLQPLRPWTVDYGDTACSARTSYGSADEPLTLAFRLSPRGSSLQVMVLRQGRAQDPAHLPGSVRFAEQAQETTALRYSTADRKVQVVSLIFPREAMEPLRRSPNIEVRVRGLLDQGFALPRIDAVFRQLDHCQADLQAHWNMDEAVTAAFKAQAEPLQSLASLVSSDDYPTQALRDGRTGRVRAALLVEANGQAKDCMVEEPSGVASLDAMTCIVLMRARFNPARDANDRPVRSVVTQSIVWGMTDSKGDFSPDASPRESPRPSPVETER